MENYSVNLDPLKEDFEGLEITHKTVDFKKGTTHVFLINFKMETSESSWLKIASWLAANFQAELQDDFEVWNLYLFYSFSTSIDKSLKYKIENDTFSSRKTVLDKEMSMDDIIEKHIKNSDIDISPSSFKNSTSMLTRDTLLDSLLSHKTLREGNRRIKAVSKPTFDEYFNAIQDEETEI